ncbi:HPr(Ser) kinase/phosphatase [Fusibacter paucivorans]|uniref:HPr kinase/phosphorylase n=1 Tax=Fusibacter paucivorans TaxID=76009 RepID=A0ABS5PMT4_9FIRM|nr:HPr(Ser) kinase/phosphatase [Fusibacter paucivorans]MBS7526212.1 HPr(Ser) kinase/phosphatase [Fusibacter paucivorans]
MENYYVTMKDIADKMHLVHLTPSIDLSDIRVFQTDINRPALQLTGFFDYFDSERVQVIGKVEYTYLMSLTETKRKAVLQKLFECKIPCLILTRTQLPFPEMLQDATRFGVPILQTSRATSYFNSELNRYLKVELAPRVTKHGVLVDVYGEGVLIMGESGIGKSEVALELIKRGHRLVADDAVDIKKVSDETLLGSSPQMIRHFIEVRGIGIVDCKMLFGVESVKDIHPIDLCIQLEEWQSKKDYDRLGLEDHTIEILGNQVVNHILPVRPGRNIAIIVEATALNSRQKKMGYNAAVELDNRLKDHLLKVAASRKTASEPDRAMIHAGDTADQGQITQAQINYRDEDN